MVIGKVRGLQNSCGDTRLKLLIDGWVGCVLKGDVGWVRLSVSWCFGWWLEIARVR